MKDKTWIIHGYEGYCGDFGCCEPDYVCQVIRSQHAKGVELTEEDIERIAFNFGCWVEWQYV